MPECINAASRQPRKGKRSRREKKNRASQHKLEFRLTRDPDRCGDTHQPNEMKVRGYRMKSTFIITTNSLGFSALSSLSLSLCGTIKFIIEKNKVL